MIKEEIFKQAIEKVIENGWEKPFWIYEDANKIKYRPIGELMNYRDEILFDQNFCKAFWGKKFVCSECGKLKGCCICACYLLIQSWEYHGKEMFAAPDRLEYIKKFL